MPPSPPRACGSRRMSVVGHTAWLELQMGIERDGTEATLEGHPGDRGGRGQAPSRQRLGVFLSCGGVTGLRATCAFASLHLILSPFSPLHTRVSRRPLACHTWPSCWLPGPPRLQYTLVVHRRGRAWAGLRSFLAVRLSRSQLRLAWCLSRCCRFAGQRTTRQSRCAHPAGPRSGLRAAPH